MGLGGAGVDGFGLRRRVHPTRASLESARLWRHGPSGGVRMADLPPRSLPQRVRCDESIAACGAPRMGLGITRRPGFRRAARERVTGVRGHRGRLGLRARREHRSPAVADPPGRTGTPQPTPMRRYRSARHHRNASHRSVGRPPLGGGLRSTRAARAGGPRPGQWLVTFAPIGRSAASRSAGAAATGGAGAVARPRLRGVRRFVRRLRNL